MSWWMAALLGLVQGVAEFLPISSSGHLSIVQQLLGVQMDDKLLFDVMLHAGTLAAVCAAYREDLADMLRAFAGFFSARGRKEEKTLPTRRLILLIVIATLPLVLMVFFKDAVEPLFENLFFIGAALMTTGLLLFLSDRMPRGKKDEKTASVGDVVFVGLTQLLAVIPGLSRSGTTISSGLFRGFDRRFAVRFSFLLSIPAVLGATVLEVGDAVAQGFDASQLPACLLGVAVAALSGYFSIVLVKKLIDAGRFGKFAYYCIAVGLATVVIKWIVG